jgi:hypothetical protein
MELIIKFIHTAPKMNVRVRLEVLAVNTSDHEIGFLNMSYLSGQDREKLAQEITRQLCGHSENATR